MFWLLLSIGKGPPLLVDQNKNEAPLVVAKFAPIVLKILIEYVG